MSSEPLLTKRDLAIWEDWMMQAKLHSRSYEFKRQVSEAKRHIDRMVKRCPSAYVAWSAGKDSTALTHLVCVEMGIKARAMAIKDDLDFPGEEGYLQRLADRWGIGLDIVRPSFSLQGWLADNEAEGNSGKDMHSRSSSFADAAFYSLIERYAELHGRPGVYLGLRMEESHGRKRNCQVHGHIYEKASGDVVCQPLATWKGLDVYAYMALHDIEFLPVYRCVRLHERPDRVRKSWWLPGAASCTGGMEWLRCYYPSLFRRLCQLMPHSDTAA